MKFLVGGETISTIYSSNPVASTSSLREFAMDTLPSSVSTLKLPVRLPPSSSSSSRDFHHYFRTPTAHHSHLSSSSSSSKLPHPSSISNTNFSSYNLHLTSSSSSSSSYQLLSPCDAISAKQSAAPFHHRAAAGYAAALVDVCRRNNTMEAVDRDVRRFARLMRNEQIREIMADPLVDDSEKGYIVKEIAVKGKFQRHLVALLKTMIDRNRLGMVAEVLGQFRAIYGQLRGAAMTIDD